MGLLWRSLDATLQSKINAIGALGVAELLTQRKNYSESKIYYVDVHNGSDNAVGDTPGTALASIEQAVTLCAARIDWAESPWARQDTVVIFPGTYAENLTDLSHGIQFIGLGHDIRDAQFGVKIKPASGAAVADTSIVNSAFYNIGFESADTTAVFTSTIVNNCLFQDCWFTGPAETATNAGLFVCSDSTKTTWRRCWFANGDKGLDVNYVDAGDGFNYALIEDCYFTGIDTAGIEISSNLVGPHSMVNRSFFIGGGQTMAIGISDSSGILDVSGCYFDCTDAVNGVNSVNGSYMANALVT